MKVGSCTKVKSHQQLQQLRTSPDDTQLLDSPLSRVQGVSFSRVLTQRVSKITVGLPVIVTHFPPTLAAQTDHEGQ